MPEAIIVGHEDRTLFDLESLVRESGFRVKTATDLAKAGEWLALRDFEICIIAVQLTYDEQSALAESLWSRNPSALMLLFDESSESLKRGEKARLAGAELCGGARALATLQERLRLAAERHSQRKNGGDFRVLVVEDLDAPRDIVCSYVERLGFGSVQGESSARAALASLQNSPQRYSCVITDIRMPEMDGCELIKGIRSHPKLQNLPIIVLTAYGTADCLVDCLRAGASGFLVKPPKRRDLVRELARAARIACGLQSARLATPQEAELIRDLLIEGGQCGV